MVMETDGRGRVADEDDDEENDAREDDDASTSRAVRVVIRCARYPRDDAMTTTTRATNAREDDDDGSAREPTRARARAKRATARTVATARRARTRRVSVETRRWWRWRRARCGAWTRGRRRMNFSRERRSRRVETRARRRRRDGARVRADGEREDVHDVRTRGKAGGARGGRGREGWGGRAIDRVRVRRVTASIKSSGDDEEGVRVTYYEIYEERIIDLLARDSSLTSSSSSSSSRTLRVRWRKRDGFYVPNLTFETCKSASEALACVRRGCARRHVRANAVNAESSRSHAVLTVYLDRGKVTFVDLAGSERLKRGGGDDESSRETSLINKSLFALGKVISTLADGPNDAKASTAHVPYRDSKLTKLMMDSLGGQSLTLMIACCSSEERHARETVRTLQYAARVASIVLDVDHGVGITRPRSKTPTRTAPSTNSGRITARFGGGSPRFANRRLATATNRVALARAAATLATVDSQTPPFTPLPSFTACAGGIAPSRLRRREPSARARKRRAPRARARWLDIERVHALRDAADLRIAMENVERAFFDAELRLDDVDARLALASPS